MVNSNMMKNGAVLRTRAHCWRHHQLPQRIGKGTETIIQKTQQTLSFKYEKLTKRSHRSS